ncbi:hypothetical protein T484DRAFT_3582884 [Baffinella frigidus]|nr:hypothetical protein T484DRAFT_3582884 [Cryptophyta sp. CCMP2293]
MVDPVSLQPGARQPGVGSPVRPPDVARETTRRGQSLPSDAPPSPPRRHPVHCRQPTIASGVRASTFKSPGRVLPPRVPTVRTWPIKSPYVCCKHELLLQRQLSVGCDGTTQGTKRRRNSGRPPCWCSPSALKSGDLPQGGHHQIRNPLLLSSTAGGTLATATPCSSVPRGHASFALPGIRQGAWCRV